MTEEDFIDFMEKRFPDVVGEAKDILNELYSRFELTPSVKFESGEVLQIYRSALEEHGFDFSDIEELFEL